MAESHKEAFQAIRHASQLLTVNDLKAIRARIRKLQHERWGPLEEVWVWKQWDKDFWADTLLPAICDAKVPHLTAVLHNSKATLFTARVSTAMQYGVELNDKKGLTRVTFNAWAFAELVRKGCVPVRAGWQDFVETVSLYATSVLLQKMCRDVLDEAHNIHLLPHLTAKVEWSDDAGLSPLKSATISRIIMTCLDVVRPVVGVNINPYHLPLSAMEMEFIRQGARVFVMVQTTPADMEEDERLAILCWMAIALGSTDGFAQHFAYKTLCVV